MTFEHRALAAANRISQLGRAAQSMTRIARTTSKPVMAFIAQPVIFAHEEFALREGVYVNGVEDLFIDALTYNCYMVGPPVTGVSVQSLSSCLHMSPVSVMMDNPASTPTRIGEVDFRWNYRVEGKACMFLPGAGEGDGLLPRTLLGYPEMGDILRFPRPLRIRASESIAFLCKPTLRSMLDFTDGPGNSQDRLVVEFVAIGYRTGAQAWSAIR